MTSAIYKKLEYFESFFGDGLPYFYGILAYGFQCLGNLQIKFLPGVPSMQITFARNLQFVIFSYFHLRYLGVSHTPKVNPTHIRRVIGRSLLGTVSLGLFIGCVRALPLSEVVILYQTLPIFTSLFAYIYLDEKFEKTQLYALIGTLLGAILVVKPPFLFGSTGDKSYLQLIAGGLLLVIAAIDSMAYIMIKQVGGKIPSQMIVFYYGIIGCFFSTIANFIFGMNSLGPWELFYLLLIGVFYYLTQLTRNRAFMLGRAGKVSLTGSSEVVYSLLVDFLYFGFVPDGWSLMGSGLIVGCVSMLMLSQSNTK